MTEFVRKVVPGATVHRLLGEGHFSYFCFCDECHRQIFSTLFGIPEGPLSTAFNDDENIEDAEDIETPSEQNCEEISDNHTEQNELS